MNVLFFVNDLQVGGTEVQAVKLARVFRSRGRSASIVCFSQGPLAEKCLKLGIPVVDLRKEGEVGKDLWAKVKLVFHLTRFIRQLPAGSHCIFMMPHVFCAGCLVAKVTGHFVYYSRRQRNFSIKKSIWFKFIMQLSLKFCDEVWVNSRELLNDLVEEKVPADRIHIVPNLIDEQLIQRHHAETNVIRLISVGNFFFYKGYFEFLTALSKLKVELIIEWHVFGREVEFTEAEFKSEAERLGFGQLIVHGFKQNPFEGFGIGDILVVASSEEGCSNAMLEGISHGLFILSTQVGGVDEFIDDDNGAVLDKDFSNLDSLLRRSITNLESKQRAEYCAKQLLSRCGENEVWEIIENKIAKRATV